MDPWVVMVQIINHATEHREQIKSMLTALGLAPHQGADHAFGQIGHQLADARRSAALIDKLPASFERMTASIGLDPAGYHATNLALHLAVCALVFLAVGLISSGIQFYFSATYRGSTAPNNMRLFARRAA